MEHDEALEDGPPPPLNWWPMSFSVFILFYPLELLKWGDADAFDWALAVLAVVAFLALFALAVVDWQRQRPFLWVPVTLCVLSIVLAPYGHPSHYFMLYAAALCPWAVNGNVQRCVILAVLSIYLAAFFAAILPRAGALWLIDVPLYIIGHVATGAWIVRMMLSIRRLGRVAIRERITRDLHDVLDNALAVITTKSERVGRMLAERVDVARVQGDIEDIEGQARRALSNVRQALRRYRSDVPDYNVPARINWWPMIFTIYSLLLPVGFWRSGGGTSGEWQLVLFGVVACVALVAVAISCWQRRRPFLYVFFLMTLLGASLAQITPSAMVLLGFAAAIVPFAVNGNIARTVYLTGFLLAVELFVGDWRSATITVVIVAGYLWAVRTSLRYLSLVKVAERERIARDLHDVLGHTLSVIALKAELARRLLADARNLERARSEMADLEHTAQQALADVRNTILGEHTETIDAEFNRATSTLRTAGISVNCQREQLWLHTVHEGVLGLALREAVTNVVRHAAASECQIRLQRLRNTYVLEVQDNGRGDTGSEGLGLRGMRERIEALGGSVLRDISAGTRLTVRLPAAPMPA